MPPKRRSLPGTNPMPKIVIKSWVHANICVSDLGRSVAFYEMLGFAKVEDQMFDDSSDCWRGLGIPENAEPRQFRAVFMAIPDSEGPILDIIEFINPQAAGQPYPTLYNLGTCRLCFEVDDVDEVARVLEGAGVETVSSPARYECGSDRPASVEGIRFICFRDPDGTFLEFVSRPGGLRA